LNGDIKIGKLLCDADVITKRQLNVALQAQIKGDKRSLGEVLVEKEFCTLDDITEVIMRSTDENGHEEHHDAIIEKIEGPQALELSEEKLLGTKFTLSLQTMITAGVGISSLIGMWYALQAEIQEAKELPSIDHIYELEYPSKITAHNWPSSMEQYEVQVGGLTEDMDGVYELLEEYEEKIEELEDKVQALQIKIARKGG